MYVFEVLATGPYTKIEADQVSHYGKVEFRTEELRDFRYRLESHLNSCSLFPASLFPAQPDQAEFSLRLE
jgi:hypothetical protein